MAGFNLGSQLAAHNSSPLRDFTHKAPPLCAYAHSDL